MLSNKHCLVCPMQSMTPFTCWTLHAFTVHTTVFLKLRYIQIEHITWHSTAAQWILTLSYKYWHLIKSFNRMHIQNCNIRISENVTNFFHKSLRHSDNHILIFSLANLLYDWRTGCGQHIEPVDLYGPPHCLTSWPSELYTMTSITSVSTASSDVDKFLTYVMIQTSPGFLKSTSWKIHV